MTSFPCCLASISEQRLKTRKLTCPSFDNYKMLMPLKTYFPHCLHIARGRIMRMTERSPDACPRMSFLSPKPMADTISPSQRHPRARGHQHRRDSTAQRLDIRAPSPIRLGRANSQDVPLFRHTHHPRPFHPLQPHRRNLQNNLLPPHLLHSIYPQISPFHPTGTTPHHSPLARRLPVHRLPHFRQLVARLAH